MPNNIRLRIHNEKTNSTEVIEGRLIGYVDDEELRAIINTKDAAKKIFTSETVKYRDLLDAYRIRQRIVVASSSIPSLKGRAVYISPPIIYTSWLNKEKRLVCKNFIINVEEINNAEGKA